VTMHGMHDILKRAIRSSSSTNTANPGDNCNAAKDECSIV
jgi:hypothetical protein